MAQASPVGASDISSGGKTSAGALQVLRAVAATLTIAVALTIPVSTGWTISTEDGNTTPTTSTAPGVGSAPFGPGISVEAARRGDVRGPVLVKGYLLIVSGKPVRICDRLTQARPPRCAGASLEVHGLPADRRKRLATARRSGGSTRWSPQPVRVLGNVRKATLVVQANAKA
jgi:hypothetical protein